MPKVMIVDDDRTMVSLLATLLELDGYSVVKASNESDFRNQLAAETPDLVIMDVFLKNSDGTEIVRELRANPESALGRTPVIMTSGMEISSRCIEAGANSFLLKPYDPEDLLQVVRNQLGRA